MTVEGAGISSISRIKCFSWNTIAMAALWIVGVADEIERDEVLADLA